MERLTFEDEKYVAIEAAVHLARYSMVRSMVAGKRVLDVACGEGYGAYMMATRWGAAQVTAIDISEEAVEAARRNFGAGNIAYEVMAAGDLSRKLPPKSFDLVVSLETIEHLDEPEGFLREITRVCTDDATIVISCPNDPAHYLEGHAGNPFHMRTYTARQFFELAEGVLGPCKGKFVGVPIAGFGNFLLGSALLERGTQMRSMLDGYRVETTPLTVPPDDIIGGDDASYYIGVWGGDGLQMEGAVTTLYPTALNSSALAELSAEVTRLRTQVWDLTHAASSLADGVEPRDGEVAASRARLQVEEERGSAAQAEIADMRARLREQALRIHVLSAENKLAREGVAHLTERLNQASGAMAVMSWGAVGVYRRIRRYVPNSVAGSIRKMLQRSK